MSDHGECVGAWLLAHAKAGLSPEDELVLFERALAALWQRARKTLGELTLATIVDRVLGTAAAKHPVIAGLHMEDDKLVIDELRRRVTSVPDGQLRAAFRDVLVDWLSVVGNLTAEILTPALHEALAQVTLSASAPPWENEEKQ